MSVNRGDGATFFFSPFRQPLCKSGKGKSLSTLWISVLLIITGVRLACDITCRPSAYVTTAAVYPDGVTSCDLHSSVENNTSTMKEMMRPANRQSWWRQLQLSFFAAPKYSLWCDFYWRLGGSLVYDLLVSFCCSDRQSDCALNVHQPDFHFYLWDTEEDEHYLDNGYAGLWGHHDNG